MADPTTTPPGIDPTMKAIVDAFPLHFTVEDGVEVAREKIRALEQPAELLPAMRIEQRTVGYGELDDIPVRIYWPPIEEHANLPVVVFYHGGGWAVGDWIPKTGWPGRTPSARRRSWCRWITGWRRSTRSPQASMIPGRRCAGSVTTPPSSAATRPASRSPGIPRAATFRP
jgi:hypothetical protein